MFRFTRLHYTPKAHRETNKTNPIKCTRNPHAILAIAKLPIVRLFVCLFVLLTDFFLLKKIRTALSKNEERKELLTLQRNRICPY